MVVGYVVQLNNLDLILHVFMLISMSEKNTLSSDTYIINVFVAWTVAFSIIEPIVSIVFFGRERGITSTNKSVAIIGDFLYTSIIFTKTIWAYNQLYEPANVFPASNDYAGLRRFIMVHIVIELVINSIWNY